MLICSSHPYDRCGFNGAARQRSVCSVNYCFNLLHNFHKCEMYEVGKKRKQL